MVKRTEPPCYDYSVVFCLVYQQLTLNHVSFLAIDKVYKSTDGMSRYQVHMVDEIGPTTATNLCYVKGHYIDCTTTGEVANAGRCVRNVIGFVL